jgi:hypothetical protein
MSITAEISVKILKVTQHGQCEADVEVEMSMNGKAIGRQTYRVNRTGKDAELVAVAAAKKDGAALAPPPKNTPKPADE